MLDELQLRAVLQELQAKMPVSSVEVSQEGLRFVATVISEKFEGQDDAVRQAIVWDHLLRRLSEDEQAQVEFVFTLTPDEALSDAR